MSYEVITELAVSQIPDLYQTIPTTGHDKWDGLRGGESYTGDPFGVAFGFATNLVLAFSKGIPQSDCSITGT